MPVSPESPFVWGYSGIRPINASVFVNIFIDIKYKILFNTLLMGTKKPFHQAASPIIGKTYIDLGDNALVVGDIYVELSAGLAEMVNVLMYACLSGQRVSPEALCSYCRIPSLSIFEQQYTDLIVKLNQHPIANYGGNGSYYDETIYASELIRRDQHGLYFYSSLAYLIEGDPYPSDESFSAIKYLPRNYKPILSR